MSESLPNATDSHGFENSAAETECLNCGARVSRQFARVMGDNRNRVHACLNCSDQQNVSGAAGGISE